jgi:hypothetical protein
MMRPPGFGPTEQKNGTNGRCALTPIPFEIAHTHTSVSIVCMSEASIETDGTDAFVVYNGVRIAKRGQPNTPQAGTWVSLEPGYRVFEKGYPLKLVIERDGKIIKNVW